MTQTAAGSFLLNIPTDPDLVRRADIAGLAKASDVEAAKKALTDRMDAIAATIAKLQGPAPSTPAPTTTTPTPAAPAATGPWPPAADPADKITLPEGTFTGVYATAKKLTVQGAGMRKTILDGQKGVGSGHRLAWGKGIIHAGAEILVQDVGFINGGGGDGKSDAEAGFYGEGFEGTATLLRCAFDACENGIFVPSGDLAKFDLVLDSCVFGRTGGNALADGRSHDMYVSGKSTTIRNSIFLGNSRGNTVKCRGLKLTLENNHIRRVTGRWVDLPGGTECVSRNNVYVTNPGSNSQNALGFYDEADTSTGQTGFFHSENDTFYFSRGQGEHIWINLPTFDVTFTNPKVFWVGAPGAKPPIVSIDGPGKINGPNPFELNADNRVDVAPAVPADPNA
jgi:hypothetical protein